MKSLLLVGSSIFKAWAQAGDLLPNYRTVNRAVDGTTTSYWIQHLADIMAAESPDVVLYYCGSNDLNCEIPQETILTNVRECRAIISQQSHSTKFAYFAIIKAPQKAGKWDIIDNLNRNISVGLHADDIYIDSNTLFFRNGTPVAEWFIEDGLHLTVDAYDRFSGYVAPLIRKWLNE